MWNRLKIAELQSIIMSVLPCLWTVRCAPSDVSRTLLLELYNLSTCHRVGQNPEQQIHSHHADAPAYSSLECPFKFTHLFHQRLSVYEQSESMEVSLRRA